MIGSTQEKAYYTISEVSEKLGLNSSTLRYWQEQFEIISPKTNKNGDRRYTPEDIADIKIVHHLLKEKGLKLKSAKEELKNRKKELSTNRELIDRLENIKSFLKDLEKSI